MWCILLSRQLSPPVVAFKLNMRSVSVSCSVRSARQGKKKQHPEEFHGSSFRKGEAKLTPQMEFHGCSFPKGQPRIPRKWFAHELGHTLTKNNDNLQKQSKMFLLQTLQMSRVIPRRVLLSRRYSGHKIASKNMCQRVVEDYMTRMQR